jgi:hypothetical protein
MLRRLSTTFTTYGQIKIVRLGGEEVCQLFEEN